MRLIDAEALKVNFEANTPVAFQDMIPGIHYIIDRARTIDAVKHGRWIEIERNDVNPFTGRRGVYVGCSECHAPIPTDSQLDFMDEGESKYCYNCGARMEEDNDS